jgi:hypothetical protein
MVKKETKFECSKTKANRKTKMAKWWSLLLFHTTYTKVLFLQTKTIYMQIRLMRHFQHVSTGTDGRRFENLLRRGSRFEE